MHFPAKRSGNDSAVLENVRPPSAELAASIHVDVVDADHDGCAEVDGSFRRVFVQRHHADVQAFHSTLRSFRNQRRPRVVVSLGGVLAGCLLAEPCPEQDAQELIGALADQQVADARRRHQARALSQTIKSAH